jgi:hypothetical protein
MHICLCNDICLIIQVLMTQKHCIKKCSEVNSSFRSWQHTELNCKLRALSALSSVKERYFASLTGQTRRLNVVHKCPQWAVVYVRLPQELIPFSSTWTSRYLSLNSHGNLSLTQCECVPLLRILFRRWIEKKSITSIRHSRAPSPFFYRDTQCVPSHSIRFNYTQ